MPPSREERREALKAVYHQANACTMCPQLAATRTTVVFGSGNSDADLMFVGEAPGANEDRQGLPFVGQAGKLLDTLLGEIGLSRGDVFVANVLKCLGPGVPVQLVDGTWERIGRLVRSRYDGEVMSVDADGRIVARRVIGWHASPVAGRAVLRLTYASAPGPGAGRVGTELTGDHPVLTRRGYVQACDLTGDDQVAVGQGLSSLAHDVVCGTLLGDGSIEPGSARLTFGHAERRAHYAGFKAQLLAELDASVRHLRVAAVVGGPAAYPVAHVATRASRALGVLGRAFSGGDAKAVPAWLGGELNERMLAFWFMDHGHLRPRGGGRQPLAEIATVGFAPGDVQTLIAGLARLGLAAKASRGRLYFDAPASRALSEAIAPYVPPVMRDKLQPAVAAAVPFAPERLEAGPRRTLFDDVEIEDITNRPRRDTTFCCIDVEQTHNFVTSGGVVHNCRPPGNRDPHPAEIEACQGYLMRQVELIEPRVICTLGNFATKLLRGDPTGITRLHGREEVRTVGSRAVRLYPIFHPAAALYTPANVDVLRADFRRLPDLLALAPPEQPRAEEAPVLPVDEEPPRALPQPEPEAELEPEREPDPVGPVPPAQLGLF